ncbi:MAG: hypothetical protein OEM39_08240, partial [Acidimicrobiia bacterium]|nr:hypothetical protein [Acidimicrobiia bacterium]
MRYRRDTGCPKDSTINLHIRIRSAGRIVNHIFLAVAMLAALVFTAPRVHASHEELCYVFADGGDRLGLLDRSTGVEIAFPNTAGVPDIEAMELDPITGVLYAIDADQLGILDQTTGIFSPVGGPIGDGFPGRVAMND